MNMKSKGLFKAKMFIVYAISLFFQIVSHADSQLISISSEGNGKIGVEVLQPVSKFSYFQRAVPVVDVVFQRSPAGDGLEEGHLLRKGSQNNPSKQPSHQTISDFGAMSQRPAVGYCSEEIEYVHPAVSENDAIQQITRYDSEAIYFSATGLPKEQLQPTVPDVAFNPIIDDFARRMSQIFSKNATKNFVFNVANIPASDLSNLFTKYIFEKIFPRNSTIASIAVDDLSPVMTWCFDRFNPIQYRLMYGRALGNILLKRGLLRPHNVDQYANFAFNDIVRASEMENALNTNGYAKALVNAPEIFFNRFGFAYLEIFDDVVQEFMKELSKGPY